MNIRNKISPFVASCIAVWFAWALITFTERIYYAENPVEVALLWAKIRFIQAFNGLWATLLLFEVYHRVIQKTTNLSITVKVIGVTALTYLWSLGLVLINMTVYRYLFDKSPLMLVWERYLIVAFSKFFIILGLSILFFLILHWKELQSQKEKTLTAIAIANEAQLQMLRYQLNPHFLFNALNSIRSLVYLDAAKADRMITDLSEFLRYTLTEENSHKATLAEEIDIIKRYLEIQKIRFEDKLETEVTIQKEALEVKVPCFLIHPLVENAIKYSVATSRPPLQLAIAGSYRDDTLRIKISNSGKLSGHNDCPGNGTGLKNIRRRLDHFYPHRNSLEISENSGRVDAEIRIETGETDASNG